MVLASSISYATATVGSSAAPLSQLASAASNPVVVGGSWMLSTILFSTYYTTIFLKHGIEKEKSDLPERQVRAILDSPIESSSSMSKSKSKKHNVRNIVTSTLRNMSRPQLLTIYRFGGSLMLGTLLHPKVSQCWNRLQDTIASSGEFAIPAFFLFLANYCNSVALDRIGISLAYTSKCIIPIITVLLTLAVDGLDAMPPIPALLSLIPIASGVAMASWNSPTFEKKGFAAAMLSSTAQSALNVSSKRALVKTGISGLQAQQSMASVALIISIAVSGLRSLKQRKTFNDNYANGSGSGSGSGNGNGTTTDSNNNTRLKLPPVSLSVAAVAAYHFEYVLSFLFLKLVQPISYGTCDAVRRLGIIIAGRKMFGGEPFSKLNFIGIGTAIMGALSYSIANSAT
uniref:Sugar phosphate transporter domain-containing protein n=1 Tax=Chaetoceros debilis TaxID=122233 RepID=A0A7S3Q240_9STRA